MNYAGVLDYQTAWNNPKKAAPSTSTSDLSGPRGMSVSSQHSYGSGGSNGGGGGGAHQSNGGNGNSLYLFPMVEKMFKIKITEDIERDLRYLGQSRADALISEFDMMPVKEQKGVQLYELVEQEFYTMKAVVLTPKASIHDVMNLMDMATTTTFRDTMGDIFGPLFLDGVVLYSSPKDVTRPNESLTVNWMALQSSKPHLPHRDYVFLKYGDCFGRESSLDADPHGTSNSFVGASIWESIEFDGCGPLPESQNVVRLKFRRCGFVIEESLTNDSLKVSFYLSESHPGRSTVSNLTKTWMTKLLMCVSEISSTLMTKHLSEQTLLARHEFTKDGHCCFICLTKFSMLRRKHHCRVCGDVVCGKCSQMKSVRQNGVNKEVRICLQCSSASSAAGMRNSSASSGGNSFNPKTRAMTSSSSSNSLLQGAGGSVSSVESGYDYTDASSFPKKGVILEDTETTSHSSSPKIVLQPHYAPSPASTPGYRNNYGGGPASTSTAKPPVSGDMILLDQIDTRALPSTVMPMLPPAPNSGMALLANGGGGGPTQAQSDLVVRENSTFSYALSYSQRQEWPKAPMPRNEAARLLKVRGLYLMDPDNQFQDMVDVASTTLSCSIAAICVIGDKTGFLLAKLGLAKREVSRNILFDAHTIMSAQPTIVLDATQDVRFVHNPLVVDGNIQFYVGIPLVTADGSVIGSFSVADQVARKELTGDQLYFLQNLAGLALRGIESNTARYNSEGSTSTELSMAGNGSLPTATYSQALDEDLDLNKAQYTMQELLNKAYATQVKVTMAATTMPAPK
ncbi:Aste57867_25209 [Aphanomyces stellatus]|uniref:Aste57867_25209 protein n=1 Tax=Aphanomyces stellatus TaxID=120398 RepID=A0A485LSI0_9STRA|nr:hypothetical protein As57867_025131 [Aphanomyces stellatus]VFU01836.1 Aste57867_25209 [Aphanomyces stellatus]